MRQYWTYQNKWWWESTELIKISPSISKLYLLYIDLYVNISPYTSPPPNKTQKHVFIICHTVFRKMGLSALCYITKESKEGVCTMEWSEISKKSPSGHTHTHIHKVYSFRQDLSIHWLTPAYSGLCNFQVEVKAQLKYYLTFSLFWIRESSAGC